jgi:hypothetical protein
VLRDSGVSGTRVGQARGNYKSGCPPPKSSRKSPTTALTITIRFMKSERGNAPPSQQTELRASDEPWRRHARRRGLHAAQPQRRRRSRRPRSVHQALIFQKQWMAHRLHPLLDTTPLQHHHFSGKRSLRTTVRTATATASAPSLQQPRGVSSCGCGVSGLTHILWDAASHRDRPPRTTGRTRRPGRIRWNLAVGSQTRIQSVRSVSRTTNRSSTVVLFRGHALLSSPCLLRRRGRPLCICPGV